MGAAKSARQKLLIESCLRGEKRAFRKRFGRDPEASDVAYRAECCGGELTFQAIRKSELPSHFAYAYRKTGLLITADANNKNAMRLEDLKRWDAALGEYFEMRRKGAGEGESQVH